MEKEKSSEKKIQVLLIIVLVAISAGAVLYLTMQYSIIGAGPTGPVLSTTYSAISPTNASQLIQDNDNLVLIVDCRTCKCNYNKNHLYNATWTINSEDFYNTTNDLLVYDNNEEKITEFCEELVGHTWGEIYYLEGGMDAWKNAELDYWKP